MAKQTKHQDGRKTNALKHGAFGMEISIFEENEREFEQLHKGFVEDLKPRGRMEEELVLEIAKLHWRKRRIERFYAREADWVQVDASGEKDLETVDYVNRVITKGLPCRGVWELVMTHLPESFRDDVEQELQCPSEEYDDEWIDKLKKFIEGRALLVLSAFEDKRRGKRFLGESASKLMDLSAKCIAIEERLDALIDRTFKRLVQVKTYKEVVVTQSAGAGRKLASR